MKNLLRELLVVKLADTAAATPEDSGVVVTTTAKQRKRLRRVLQPSILKDVDATPPEPVKVADESAREIDAGDRHAAGALAGLAGILAGAGAAGYHSEKLHDAIDALGLRPDSPVPLTAVRQQTGSLRDIPIVPYPGLGNAGYVSPFHFGILGRAATMPVLRAKMDNDAFLAKAKAMGVIVVDPKMKTNSIVAHELGHADIRNRPFYSPSRLNQSFLRPVGDVVRAFGPLLGGIVGAVSGNPLVGLGVGGGIGGLAALPTLVNEYQASAYAKKLLDRLAISRSRREDEKKILDRAYKTHAYSSLLPGAVAGLAGGIAGRVMARQRS